ncbi:MAG: hypothetical protein ACP5KO_00300 [Caldimicrobium sp.]|jgi:hypothetical protein
MKFQLEDLLLEKPVSLIYWELEGEFKNFFSFLEGETELKILENLNEFYQWFTVLEIRNFMAGVKKAEKIKEINQLLEKLPIEKRREIFIIYISPEVETLDTKGSFLYSANLLVNERDLKDMERIYSKAKTYWVNLYKPYFQAMAKFLEEEL